jgi:hypothetical protein
MLHATPNSRDHTYGGADFDHWSLSQFFA